MPAKNVMPAVGYEASVSVCPSRIFAVTAHGPGKRQQIRTLSDDLAHAKQRTSDPVARHGKHRNLCWEERAVRLSRWFPVRPVACSSAPGSSLASRASLSSGIDRSPLPIDTTRGAIDRQRPRLRIAHPAPPHSSRSPPAEAAGVESVRFAGGTLVTPYGAHKAAHAAGTCAIAVVVVTEAHGPAAALGLASGVGVVDALAVAGRRGIAARRQREHGQSTTQRHPETRPSA